MSWINRLLGSLRKNRLENRLDDELRFHIEMRAQEFIAAGMTAEEARYRAQRLFGNRLLLKERTREMDTIGWIETLLQDVRYAFRMLRKNPGFTLVAVMTLALGIGANTAIFTVVNAVLLRPLYNQDPGRLVRLSERFRNESGIPISPADLLDWKRQSRSFAWIAGYMEHDMTILGGSEPDWVTGAQVDASLFRSLGVQPLLGRTFLPEEAQPGRDRVILLSFKFWRERFGSDPGVLGKTVILEGRDPFGFLASRAELATKGAYTVVGVMQPYFQFPTPVSRVDYTDYEAWIPLSFYGSWLNTREDHSLGVVAYLKPNVSLKQAQVELDGITRRIGQEHEAGHREIGGSVVPLQEVYVSDLRPQLTMLLGAVGFVLLIGCANIANLQLIRSTARQKEIAIRIALGATRRRITEQLFTESLLLAALGCVASFFLAHWGTNALITIFPEAMSHFWKIGVDSRVLLFALGISLMAGVLFGLAPAVQASSLELNQSLKETARTLNAGARGRFLRKLFLVSEVAMSFVLLVGAGLLIRSFLHVQDIDLGFRPDHVMTLQVNLTESRYPTAEQRAIFFEKALKRIETIPGVESAGASTELPLISGTWGGRITVEDQPSGELGAAFIMVSPNYFRTMGTPLRTGRYFTERDRLEPGGVGMVSERLARQIWPHGSPLGKRLGLFLKPEAPTRIEIVGVVGDVKHFGPENESVSAVYLPDFRASSNTWAIYVMRSQADPFSVARSAEREIHNLDKDVPVGYFRPMNWWLASTLAARRFNTLLVGIFAAVAVLLASVGIYGVISYSVTQRTQEIGIRIALGAQGSSVLQLVVGQGLRLAFVGLGIGLVASLALTRVLSSLLFGISATDPITFAGVASVLMTVALLACYVPARRAMKVDPMVALRHE